MPARLSSATESPRTSSPLSAASRICWSSPNRRAFNFRDRNLPPAEIGRLLNARYLLEGSVQRAGDRVRVTVELTEAATGRNLWSQAYDAEVKDIFAVQDDIARRVVGAAAVTLTRFERDRALAKPTASLAAYEYVLRGREYFSHATREDNDEAQDMFQRAIDLDPSYAAAYAQLGLSLVEAVTSGWSEFVADDLDRAEKLAQKALSLDPASTAAYRVLAEVDLQRGRFDLALGQTDRALEINPSDAESFAERGAILAWCRPSGGGRAVDRSARFASTLPTPEPTFISAWPTISSAVTAKPSRPSIALSPAISAATPRSWDGRCWRPPMPSWIDPRTPRASGPRRCNYRHSSTPRGLPGNSARRQARDHMLEGLKKAGFR